MCTCLNKLLGQAPINNAKFSSKLQFSMPLLTYYTCMHTGCVFLEISAVLFFFLEKNLKLFPECTFKLKLKRHKIDVCMHVSVYNKYIYVSRLNLVIGCELRKTP